MLTLLLDNIRSAYNTGTILRTADAAGAERVILAGLTPHPSYPGDPRPAHVADRAARLLAKTALGAEKTLGLVYETDAAAAVQRFKSDGYHVLALELAPNAQDIFDFTPPAGPLLLCVGHEVDGVSPEILAAADNIIQIPMRGAKESLNVAVATGIALYRLTR